jgi:hypothetical protein
MELTVSSNDVSILLEVHVESASAVPLPGSSQSWLPTEVLLDESPSNSLFRSEAGALWLMVPEGVHGVALLGKTASGNSFQIPLPLKPRFSTFHSNGWRVQGIQENGQVEGILKLTRLEKLEDEGSSPAGAALPPFLHIERALSLAMMWQVQTTVKRVTPKGSPIVISVPLLPNESVTSAGIRVEKGKALINMEPNMNEVVWNSTLEISPRLSLAAPRGVPWTERWVLDASPIWRCKLSGIPVIHQQDEEGYWKPQWRPWPGEKVAIDISRPKAIPGQLVTIDRVRLHWTPGARLNKGKLEITIRTSKGGQHKVGIPENAKLQSIRIDGKSQPIQEQGSEVTLPLHPGSQTVDIEWRQGAASSFITTGPKVHVGQNAVNVNQTFTMSPDRWILWAGGPRMGPTVLFWSTLIVFLMISFALGRITWTPLRAHHWFLLGLGLTQVHVAATVVVVGWLLALGWRQRRPSPKGWLTFDAGQVLVALWTVIALLVLYTSIEKGLLGRPEMQIAGNGSYYSQLNWTQDRIDGDLPQPWVFSLPLLVYRLLMFFWALWIARALLRWLRWGWKCFNEGGIWRKIQMGKVKGGKRGGQNHEPEPEHED